VTQKHPRSTAGLPLPDKTAVESHMIRIGDPNAQNRELAVNGDAPRTNPILHLATRSKARARQHLLQSLSFPAATATFARGVCRSRSSTGLGWVIFGTHIQVLHIVVFDTIGTDVLVFDVVIFDRVRADILMLYVIVLEAIGANIQVLDFAIPDFFVCRCAGRTARARDTGGAAGAERAGAAATPAVTIAR
jgi:hypothetical protein